MKKDKIVDLEEAKKLCYNFAAGMKKKHNEDKIQERKVWEIFRDDFRGKLAEIEVRNKIIKDLSKEFYIKTDVDFTISEKGVWDTDDLVIGVKNSDRSYSLSIKSVKKHSSNLLIERERFLENGEYSYKNNNGEDIQVDIYVLVEVAIEKEFNKSIYNEKLDKFISYEELMKNKSIKINILGAISHDSFWESKAFAPMDIICTAYNLKYIYWNKEKENVYDTLPEYFLDDEFNEEGYKRCIRKIWEKGIYKYDEQEIHKDSKYILKKDNYFVIKDKLKSLDKVLLEM